MSHSNIDNYLNILKNCFQSGYAALIDFNHPAAITISSESHNAPALQPSDSLTVELRTINKISYLSPSNTTHLFKASDFLKATDSFPYLTVIPVETGAGLVRGALVIAHASKKNLQPHQTNLLSHFNEVIVGALEQENDTPPPNDQTHELWKLQFALSHPTIGVWEACPETGTIQWDHNMNQLFQLMPTQEINHWDEWLNMVVPEHQSMVNDAFSAYQQGSDPGILVFRIRTATGRVISIECRGSHYYDLEGQWQYTIGSCRDVTEQVKTAASLEHQTNLALKALRVKSEFIACISHEIRTPMNGLIGMIDLLSGSSLDETQNEYIRVAKHSGRTILAMVNDILDYSKFESDSVILEKRVFNLSDEIDLTCDSLRANLNNKPVEFIIDNQLKKDHFIQSDAIRIQQIFNNLINNAIKFTEAGCIEVKVSSEPLKTKQEKIHFSIKDSGIGIGEDKIDSLFTMFTQADSSTTRKYGGTGIGLAIIKKIISLMSGSIEVESTIGEGSIFYGYFMVDSAPEDHCTIEAIQDINAISFPGLNVLLVEDLELNRQVATHMLKKLGVNTTMAVNGQEAIHLLLSESTRFDLILMDCEMPVMDGFTATELIRSGEAGDHYKETVIAAVTAHVTEDQKLRTEAVGMNHFISKPITRLKLAKLLSGLKG